MLGRVLGYKGVSMILGFSLRITEKFAIDITLLNKYRSFEDGIDFFQIICESDFYEGDHNPSFNFFFVILNIALIEINIYNVNHYSEIEIEEINE
jgi:hypothetical protein